MNYLVLTRAGYEAIRDNGDTAAGDRLWLNPSLLADDEYPSWRGSGVEFRILSEAVDPTDQSQIVEAIEVIEAEFPDEVVLSEYR